MGMGPGWLLLLLILVLLVWWFFLRKGAPHGHPDPDPDPDPDPEYPWEPEASVDVVPPGRVRDAIVESIGSAVAGRRPGDEPLDRVVWSDLGDEVLVHLDSLTVEVDDGLIRAGLDLESDQTGRQTLVVPIAVGGHREEGVTLAVTESVPMGHAGLAARWGQAVQAAVWSGVLDYARERADVAEGIPGRIWVEDGRIFFEASKPLRATAPVIVGTVSSGAGAGRGAP